MSFTVNDPGRPSVSSRHAHGPYVAMADGSIRPVAGIAPEVMEAMLRHESAWPPKENAARKKDAKASF